MNVIPVAVDTAAAKVGVVSNDVVVIAIAVNILGVRIFLWCCWYYNTALVVI